jgi:hypothetical protein
MKTKICATCKIKKVLSEFNKNKKAKDGLNSSCRNCQKLYQIKWNDLNREKVKIYSKKYRNENKKEWLKRNKDWRESHKEHLKNYRHEQDLVYNYNITREQYNQMLESQNGVCAICGKEETIVDKRINRIILLAVDHDHQTGKVRGLLCSHCNKALGGFKDNTGLLNKAINYLNK